jgi:hypothetical protein
MLPRSSSKCVSIGADRYRYVVSEDKPSDGDSVALVVTIQDDSANGALLRVTGLIASRVPVEESKWYDGRTVHNPLKPSHVVGLIARARQAGWNANKPGPPYVMVVANETFSLRTIRNR